jgi:hypothetical protein
MSAGFSLFKCGACGREFYIRTPYDPNEESYKAFLDHLKDHPGAKNE